MSHSPVTLSALADDIIQFLLLPFVDTTTLLSSCRFVSKKFDKWALDAIIEFDEKELKTDNITGTTGSQIINLVNRFPNLKRLITVTRIEVADLLQLCNCTRLESIECPTILSQFKTGIELEQYFKKFPNYSALTCKLSYCNTHIYSTWNEEYNG
jgi:hypothetical protein